MFSHQKSVFLHPGHSLLGGSSHLSPLWERSRQAARNEPRLAPIAPEPNTRRRSKVFMGIALVVKRRVLLPLNKFAREQLGQPTLDLIWRP